MRKRNILTLALLVVYLGMVGWCCFGHFSDLPDIGQDNLFGIPMDKVVHFLMFFPFPILCYLAFSGMTGRPRHTVLAVSLVFLAGCLIAAGTEIGSHSRATEAETRWISWQTRLHWPFPPSS